MHCHEGILEECGIASCIFRLGTKQGEVISLTNLHFTLEERVPSMLQVGGWMSPRGVLFVPEKGKTLCLCWYLNHDLSVALPIA
jgi:hypothetical protein